VATAATSPATAAASPATAATSPTTSAPSISGLQTRAQELAGQIAANGRTLDELSASFEAAQIRFQKLTAQQAGLRQSMSEAQTNVTTARQALKDQALLAYLAGGAPIIAYLPDHPGLDPSLTVAYAEIVTGGQKNAVDAYRASLDSLSRQKAQLDSTTEQVQVTLQTIQSDRSQASATMAAQKQTLSQLKGQLAVEVARFQARQQAAAQARQKAELAASVAPPVRHPTSTTTTAPRPSVTRRAPSTARAPRNPGRPSTTTTTTTTSAATTPPTGPPPPQAPGANAALSYARAQLGKPYQWGGAGPDSFDCSGLVMMAWSQAGIDFPHLAQDQYNMTAREPLSDLVPGDLVFFGTPDNVYHVGIYIGNGNMIDAPETGENVSVSSIFWDNLLGAGRVTSNS
jgi:cell wall-associated NlpC family hydrolase